MANAFAVWIRRGFGQGPQRSHPRDFDPNTGEFTLPDPEDLAEELRIRERARRDADDGLPATDSPEPAGTQREIFQYCHNRATENHQSAGRVIAQYEENIVNADLRSEQKEIENLPKAFRARSNALLGERKEALASSKRKLRTARREYEDFRSENRLNREPDYPESYLLRWGLLILAIVLESILNGFFFAEGNRMGLVGGGGLAFFLALFDILGSWRIARFTPYITSRRALHKVIGIGAILFVTSWLVLYNLGVAHYRDAMLQPTLTGAQFAVDSFLSNPFALKNAGSWLLFVLGAMFSLAAIIDGALWDDPYPGYGPRARKVETLTEDCQIIADSIGQEAAGFRESSYEALDALVRKARNELGALRGWIGSLQVLSGKASIYVDSWQEIAQTLVSRYQAENERYRKTDPPQYFGRSVEPIRVERHQPRQPFHEERLKRQEAQLDRIVALKEPTRNRIGQAYQDFLEEVRKLRGMPA